jgi:hypothetical protein
VPARLVLKAKRRKYGNQPVTVLGQRFDSKKEAARWLDLRDLEIAGKISGLERQKVYPLRVNGTKIADYVCDFRYFENCRRMVEDVKSVATRKIAAYQMKRKLMFALYGIRIRET